MGEQFFRGLFCILPVFPIHLRVLYYPFTWLLFCFPFHVPAIRLSQLPECGVLGPCAITYSMWHHLKLSIEADRSQNTHWDHFLYNRETRSELLLHSSYNIIISWHTLQTGWRNQLNCHGIPWRPCS